MVLNIENTNVIEDGGQYNDEAPITIDGDKVERITIDGTLSYFNMFWRAHSVTGSRTQNGTVDVSALDQIYFRLVGNSDGVQKSAWCEGTLDVSGMDTVEYYSADFVDAYRNGGAGGAGGSEPTAFDGYSGLGCGVLFDDVGDIIAIVGGGGGEGGEGDTFDLDEGGGGGGGGGAPGGSGGAGGSQDGSAGANAQTLSGYNHLGGDGGTGGDGDTYDDTRDPPEPGTGEIVQTGIVSSSTVTRKDAGPYVLLSNNVSYFY